MKKIKQLPGDSWQPPVLITDVIQIESNAACALCGIGFCSHDPAIVRQDAAVTDPGPEIDRMAMRVSNKTLAEMLFRNWYIGKEGAICEPCVRAIVEEFKNKHQDKEA